MQRFIGYIGLLLLLTCVGWAQSAETLPTFEAADVHVSARSVNPQTGGGFVRGGRYQFKNATMVDLISSAYGLPADKVTGGPSWLESDRFDVVAKAPTSTTNDTAKLMLRALLADRFKLLLHSEDKPSAVYALTVSKAGVKMKESSPGPTNCQGVPQNPVPGAVPYSVVACRNVTMTALAQILPQLSPPYIDHPVVDLTEIKGSFDFELKWTQRAQLAAAGSEGISFFDAVDKQLGLKLDLQTLSSPVLAVESVNRKPTDNPPDIAKRLPAVPTEFEVADIKPSMPGATPRGNLQAGGRVDWRKDFREWLLAISSAAPSSTPPAWRAAGISRSNGRAGASSTLLSGLPRTRDSRVEGLRSQILMAASHFSRPSISNWA